QERVHRWEQPQDFAFGFRAPAARIPSGVEKRLTILGLDLVKDGGNCAAESGKEEVATHENASSGQHAVRDPVGGERLMRTGCDEERAILVLRFCVDADAGRSRR